MKYYSLISFSSILILLFNSCSDYDSTIIGNPNGVFHGKIVMYDSTGAILSQGEIQLKQLNEKELTGNWNFSNGEFGKLSGAINDLKVELNLNPDFKDNNTYLIGDFNGKTIEGNWIHAGIMGINNKGTFLAKMI